ncbi:MAG: hypothetical protein AAFR73_09440 [Pseudomonadota bacterium]
MEKDLVKPKAKKSRKTPAAGIGAGPIVEAEYGNYKIRAGQLNGEFVARAFPKHSAKSQGLMAEAKGTSETDAIETLKSLLSERETTRTAARRWEVRSESTVATQEEFLEALRQTNLSAAQQSMLKAHALAGVDGLVAVAIMNAGGYKSQDAAIKALAKAGMLMADFIGLDLSEGDKNGPETALSVLGYRSAAETDVPLHLILHEELREAVWQTL